MLKRFLYSCISILFVSLLGGCDLLNPKTDIPSYIKIDSFSLNTDSATQGNNSHKITDAWIYVNDNLQGVYELPTKFPVLKTGTFNLKVYPGIKNNGISTTRERFQFYIPYILNSANLVQNQVLNLSPTTSYQSFTKFTWLENFEQQGVTLLKGTGSDTSISVIAGGPYSFNGSRFGAVYLTGTQSKAEIVSYQGFKLPTNASKIYLEFNYRSNTAFKVGVISNKSGSSSKTELYGINPTNGLWNKIYIDLTTIVNTDKYAEDYTLFFSLNRNTANSTDELYFDNIKLINE